MNRKTFLELLTTVTLGASAMKLSALNHWTNQLPNSEKMPLLFLGHGSPMNAIEENEFVHGFKTAAKGIPKPNAILCVSAHWETKGTFVTAMEQPKTVHDFGGFPQALFDVQYPAPGSPELAAEISQLVTSPKVGLNNREWGLDHGTWSVLRQMYPKADIPVVQMSLNFGQSGQYHYELAQQLTALRNKGVLIIGSGNLVHNLRMIAWDKMDNYAYDWNTEAITGMKGFISSGNHKELMNYQNQGKAWQLAIPTPEHYLPLLYVLGLQEKSDSLQMFNDKPVGGSLSMLSFKLG